MPGPQVRISSDSSPAVAMVFRVQQMVKHRTFYVGGSGRLGLQTHSDGSSRPSSSCVTLPSRARGEWSLLRASASLSVSCLLPTAALTQFSCDPNVTLT